MTFSLSRRDAVRLGAGVLGVGGWPVLARATPPDPPRPTGPLVGRISRTTDRVRVMAAWRGRYGQSLVAGEAIYVRDYISIRGFERLEIDFVDGTRVRLGGPGELFIDAFEPESTRPDSFAKLIPVFGAFELRAGRLTNRNLPDAAMPAPVVETMNGTLRIPHGGVLWGFQRYSSKHDLYVELALLEGGPVTVSSAGRDVILRNPPSITVIDSPAAAPTPPRLFGPAERAVAAAMVSF